MSDPPAPEAVLISPLLSRRETNPPDQNQLSRGRWFVNSCLAFCTPFLACVALAFYLLASNKELASQLLTAVYNTTQLAQSFSAAGRP